MQHFTIAELCASSYAAAHNIPNQPTQDVILKLQALVDNVLDPARERLGKPIRINSGYCSLKLNAAAKPFDEVWSEVAPRIAGLALVAHNKGFDEPCLRQCLEYYQIPYPGYVFHCTLSASRRVFPELVNLLVKSTSRDGFYWSSSPFADGVIPPLRPEPHNVAFFTKKNILEMDFSPPLPKGGKGVKGRVSFPRFGFGRFSSLPLFPRGVGSGECAPPLYIL